MSIVLAGLLVAIAVISYQPPPLEKEPRSADAVQQIRIERPGRPDILLKRQGDSWQLTRPYILAANVQRIEPLIGALSAHAEGYAKSEVDLLASGLEQPLATVSIDQRSYALGATDISGERRYALLNERVLLVPEWVLSLVNGGVTAFADLNVFNASIASLHISVDGGEAKPGEVADWQAITANQVVDWPIADMPPATRQARLDIRLIDNASRTLEYTGTERYGVFHYADAAYAYIVNNADLPESLFVEK